MLEINAELKEKMLKNAEIMLRLHIPFDGIRSCKNIRCKECYLSTIDFNVCRERNILEKWYNQNKPKDNSVNRLQEIDKNKWSWMLVSNDKISWEKRICFGVLLGKYVCLDCNYIESFLNGTFSEIGNNWSGWPYAKPIEQRKNTALDVMWWGGCTKVYRDKGKDPDIYPIIRLSTVNNIGDKEYNEIHLVNGHAEIKHEKWLSADELEIN